jgi:hypothetical protein
VDNLGDFSNCNLSFSLSFIYVISVCLRIAVYPMLPITLNCSFLFYFPFRVLSHLFHEANVLLNDLVKHYSDSTTTFSETDIINIREFFIDNIFVIFGGRVFQQTVGMPLGTNCAPLLADLFLYSYEADFMQGLLKKNEKKISRSLIFTFRYINDVLSLNNSSLVISVFHLAIVLYVLRYTDSDYP